MHEELKLLVKETLENNKAEDIAMTDVPAQSTIFDSIVVTSVNNPRHVQALARYLIEAAKKAGYPVVGVEGEREGYWVLVDLGVVVVHIMLHEVRLHYDIESVWGMSPYVPTNLTTLPGQQTSTFF